MIFDIDIDLSNLQNIICQKSLIKRCPTAFSYGNIDIDLSNLQNIIYSHMKKQLDIA